MMKGRTMSEDRPDAISPSDKIWLDSITRRQWRVIKDLIAFRESYPDTVDRHLVGGLFAMYELLADIDESVSLGNR